VVRQALDQISIATQINITYDLPTLALNFPPTSNALPTIIIAQFGAAVWHQRQSYFATLDHPPSTSTAANRLTTYTLDQLLPKAPKNPISTNTEIAALAMSPPEHALTFFTDGSAIPNPGPTGAGVIGKGPPFHDSDPSFQCELAAALGPGNNNTGEFYAIFAALRIAAQCLSAYALQATAPPVLIFSDSLLAICYILHGWQEEGNTPIARLTRSLFKSLAKHHEVRLYWVRGHSKVPGNEEADRLAKDGAKANESGASSINSPHIQLSLSFPPHPSMAPTLQTLLIPSFP